MTTVDDRNRVNKLKAIASFLLILLFAKVLFSIVYEYQSYFPPNFDSAFLFGRREYFVGSYRAAFYAHIISGPVALAIGFVLIVTGGRARFLRLHRLLGKTQMLIVIAAVLPSGLVMSARAFTGPIAGLGFACLSVATAACIIIAVYQAQARRFAAHQRWATRCFVLLCSPLVLRMMSGASIVLNVDSDLTYRLSAWLSWLVPLAFYEYCLRHSAIRQWRLVT